MDPHEFDRLIARTRNPRLIPGIYNYCDGRCTRCPFTERCLVFLDNDAAADGRIAEGAFVDAVGESLERTISLLTEIAQREGIDLGAVDAAENTAAADAVAVLDHEDDPLVVRARAYSTLAGRVSRALAPVVAARGEQASIEAVETIHWFSSHVAGKVYRAVCGEADGVAIDPDVQADYDGSAKAALVGIAESRAAWLVLMEAGRATADGVPAQAVKALDDLTAALRERFPRADEFVRPGFDEPAVAAGAAATLSPWTRRPPPAAT